MKEGLERKTKFSQFPGTGTGMHMHRKGCNLRFQGNHPTEWYPDQLVSKFNISTKLLS